MKKETFHARLSKEEKDILTSFARRKNRDASELFREWVLSLQEKENEREGRVEAKLDQVLKLLEEIQQPDVDGKDLQVIKIFLVELAKRIIPGEDRKQEFFLEIKKKVEAI